MSISLAPDATPKIIIVYAAIWLAVLLACFFFSLLATAVSHVTRKELLESEEIDTEFINRWQKNCERLRISMVLWQAVMLLCLAAVIIDFFNECFKFSTTAPFLPSLDEILLSVSMLFLTLVLGSCVPWFLGAGLRLKVVKRFYRFMKFFADLTAPVNYGCLYVTEAIVRILGFKISAIDVFANALDGEDGDEDKELKKEEHEMIRSIYDFGDTIAREIMTPRPDVTAVEVSTPMEEVMQKVAECNHLRIPVFEGTIDHIVGVFYARDVMSAGKGAAGLLLKNVMREPFFVPESKKAAQILIEMRRSRTQMAIVVDEYGGVAGIVSLQDIIAEIVGEMPAEFKGEVTSEIKKLDSGAYEVDSAMLVEDLNHMLDLDLAENDSYDSVGGYVMYQLGHLPSQGEKIVLDSCTIRVLEVRNRRIERLLVNLAKE